MKKSSPSSRRPSSLRTWFGSLLTPQSCRWGALAFFGAMILAGAIPGKAHALSAMVYDKLLHFVAYSMLSALVYGALTGGPRIRALLTLGAIGLLGAIDEGIQALLVYRNANLVDWQINLLAAGLTVAVLATLQAMRPVSR